MPEWASLLTVVVIVAVAFALTASMDGVARFAVMLVIAVAGGLAVRVGARAWLARGERGA